MSLRMRVMAGPHKLLVLFLDFIVLIEYFLHYLEPIFFGIMVGAAASGSHVGFLFYLAFSLILLAVQVIRSWISTQKVYPELSFYFRKLFFSRSFEREVDPVCDAEKLFLLIDDVMVYFSELPASYVGTLLGIFWVSALIAIKSLVIFAIALFSGLLMMLSDYIRERFVSPVFSAFTRNEIDTSKVVVDVFKGFEDIKLFCSFSVVFKWMELQAGKIKEAAFLISKREFILAFLDALQPALNALALVLTGLLVFQRALSISEAVYLFLYIEMFSVASHVFSGYFSYFTWINKRAEEFLKSF